MVEMEAREKRDDDRRWGLRKDSAEVSDEVWLKKIGVRGAWLSVGIEKSALAAAWLVAVRIV